MTTFQAIVYGILHGFSEIFPISSAAHRILLSYVTGWNEPAGPLLGALSASSALALLIYFIHDWASMISCFLQILIYRKKPMTPDERMPLFLGVATIPIAGIWYYFHEEMASRLDVSPLMIAATLAGFGLLLWFAESMSRRNKNMYDWNVKDSIIVGLGEVAALLPGCGRGAATMTTGFFRNFSREAAAKFSFFAALPILTASAAIHLRGLSIHQPQPMNDVSWLTFFIMSLVAFFASLLAIGAFMKHIQRSSMGQYVVWRCLVATGIVGLYFVRARQGGG